MTSREARMSVSGIGVLYFLIIVVAVVGSGVWYGRWCHYQAGLGLCRP